MTARNHAEVSAPPSSAKTHLRDRAPNFDNLGDTGGSITSDGIEYEVNYDASANDVSLTVVSSSGLALPEQSAPEQPFSALFRFTFT